MVVQIRVVSAPPRPCGDIPQNRMNSHEGRLDRLVVVRARQHIRHLFANRGGDLYCLVEGFFVSGVNVFPETLEGPHLTAQCIFEVPVAFRLTVGPPLRIDDCLSRCSDRPTILNEKIAKIIWGFFACGISRKAQKEIRNTM